jgi:4-amino-4-deoxy-L-arabinose transferase-like glycosyltransferase
MKPTGKPGKLTWWRGAAVLILGASALLLLVQLGRLPLMEPDEARNAEVGREMWESGSWVVPTYNGLPYLDKPAFYFKAVALSFAALGVNEAAARLPSALSGLAVLAVVFAFARRMNGDRQAFLAVAVIATSPLFLVFSRLVIMDTMLTLFVCAAIFAGVLAEERDGRARAAWHLGGAVCSALATLVKGPIGFILPALVLVAFFVADRRPRAILRMIAPLNVVAFFAVALPWFLAVSHARPDFPRYGLVVECMTRLTTGALGRRQPFYFFVLIVAAGCFAWSLLVPGSIVAAWRTRRQWSRQDLLGVIWCVVVLVFFSLPRSKQPAYVVNLAVPLGLLVARLFDTALDRPNGRAASVVRWGTLALAGLLAALAAALPLAAANPDAVMRIFDVSRENFDDLARNATRVAVPLAVVGILAAWTFWRRRVWLAFAVFAAVMPVLAVTGFAWLDNYAAFRSGRSMVRNMPPLPAHTEIVCLEKFPTALPFYLGRTVTLVTKTGREIPSNYIAYVLRNEKTWPSNIVRRADFDPWMRNRAHPLYIIAKKRSEDQLQPIAAAAGTPVDVLSRRFVGVLVPPQGRP